MEGMTVVSQCNVCIHSFIYPTNTICYAVFQVIGNTAMDMREFTFKLGGRQTDTYK